MDHRMTRGNSRASKGLSIVLFITSCGRKESIVGRSRYDLLVGNKVVKVHHVILDKVIEC